MVDPVPEEILNAASGIRQETDVGSRVPLGMEIDGKPSRPEVKSPVRVGKASLSIEEAQEAK